MATPFEDRPSADEARETLRQLAADEDAVRYPPIPAWFFLVQAAATAGVFLVRLLPESDGGRYTQLLAILAIALAAGGLGQKYWLNRDGVSWATARPRDLLPFLVGIVGTYALCWVVAETTGARWAWLVGAVVAATIVLATGRSYRREFG
ncbi:hypothetical protein [Blastococcus sp. TF02A-35]|uniref:hypothetical protein n=1 Tax=Blastococcus sp. TF02A-35 TaxID=2559612 RepID=UPI00107304CE|nr:hypothetical protein [Blastococcus sp. TF02A_35]TFV52647.1 hypothetical protein E4P43_04915 [Blastococcus sp. TF02A_35]